MSIVDRLGYAGVFSASALEYACFPLSSELLLPFIGCCVYNGEMELIPAVLYATLALPSGALFVLCGKDRQEIFGTDLCKIPGS